MKLHLSRMTAKSEDSKAGKISVSLTMNPYSTEAINFMKDLREKTPEILDELSIDGEAYYSGVTAKLVDERDVNNRDIVTIVILETLLILILLFALTLSFFKMPIYMMATILLSYVSALGLGIFLVDILFGYDALSTRVPVYAFIFLVALGIDYNIILASRFIEERKNIRSRKLLKSQSAIPAGLFHRLVSFWRLHLQL